MRVTTKPYAMYVLRVAACEVRPAEMATARDGHIARVGPAPQRQRATASAKHVGKGEGGPRTENGSAVNVAAGMYAAVRHKPA